MNKTLNDTTTPLARHQSQLATLIFNEPSRNGPFRQGEGIAVYRRNLLAVAAAALGVTYPTALRLLGKPRFEQLVAELLKLHPPTTGDWGEWGQELPQLIQRSGVAGKFPFVAPIATLDWLRHQANRAADDLFNPSTTELLETYRVDNLGLGLARHVGLTRSVYPLVDILDWHTDQPRPDAELQVLESPRPVLVYRRDFRVEQVYISCADYVFLRGLMAGRSIGSLLDKLDGQKFDFPGWLAEAISRNLITHLYPIQETSYATQHSISYK